MQQCISRIAGLCRMDLPKKSGLINILNHKTIQTATSKKRRVIVK